VPNSIPPTPDPIARNCALLCGRTDWITVLAAHAGRSPEAFMLSGAADAESREIAAALAEQLQCYPVAAAKYPHRHRPGMIYTRRALAQATAEPVLNWRATLVRDDRSVVDLTGGLGMDAFALATCAERMTYVEQNADLAAIARHNHALLGASAIEHVIGDAAHWLAAPAGRADALDVLFVDPDRRAAGTGKRLLRLEDCTPDVLTLLPSMRARARRALIKLSPALDIDLAFRQLEAATIRVVSVRGEVKELLAECAGDRKSPRVEAVMLDAGGAIADHVVDDWPSRTDAPAANAWSECLYEPDAALIKAGLSAHVALAHGLSFVRRGLAYLTGPDSDAPFSGQRYRIREVMGFKEKAIRRALRERGLDAVQIHRRDFPHTPDALYAAFKLKPGSQADLFFARGVNRRPQMLITERVPQSGR
jgi:GNAT superfamily N-acetyltransferase